MVMRPITIDDYQLLLAFWRANYFISKMDNYESFRLFLDKNPNLSILAEDNGEIIGSALGSFDGRRGYLQKLVVRKDFRKKGIGSQLVDEIIKNLKELNCMYIPINVEEELVSFYESCGFKKTKQIPMNMELEG